MRSDGDRRSMADRRIGFGAAGLVAVTALVAGCTDDSSTAVAEGDLDALGQALVEDGAALVTDGRDRFDGLADITRPGVSTEAVVVHDGREDEPCDVDRATARRVWWSTVAMTMDQVDPADGAAINTVYDDTAAATNGLLPDYDTVFSHDSDGTEPSWSVWRRDVDGVPLEFRVTSRLAPAQPDEGALVLVDVIGSTGCLPTE